MSSPSARSVCSRTVSVEVPSLTARVDVELAVVVVRPGRAPLQRAALLLDLDPRLTLDVPLGAVGRVDVRGHVDLAVGLRAGGGEPRHVRREVAHVREVAEQLGGCDVDGRGLLEVTPCRHRTHSAAAHTLRVRAAAERVRAQAPVSRSVSTTAGSSASALASPSRSTVHGVAVADLAGEQRPGQPVADLALHEPAQRPRAVRRVVALVGQPLQRGRR